MAKKKKNPNNLTSLLSKKNTCNNFIGIPIKTHQLTITQIKKRSGTSDITKSLLTPPKYGKDLRVSDEIINNLLKIEHTPEPHSSRQRREFSAYEDEYRHVIQQLDAVSKYGGKCKKQNAIKRAEAILSKSCNRDIDLSHPSASAEKLIKDWEMRGDEEICPSKSTLERYIKRYRKIVKPSDPTN